MNLEEKIKELVEKFDGIISVYASDNYSNEIKVNENEIVESASCIKTYILIEYYYQIMNGKKSRDDLLIYEKTNDYVANGSGIIQYLDNGLTLTSKNMAILMMIVSDNIATNKMIEYLGFDNINNTIKSLGFNNTKLLAKKLDFTLYNKIGITTAYEYARIYKMLLNKEILTPSICDEVIEILSHQTKKELLVSKIHPKYIVGKGCDDAIIQSIASKSGGLSNSSKNDIINCRNDGGIIYTKLGEYIISIFINSFSDPYFYANNKASILGAKISKMIFDEFKKNKGKFNKY